MTIPTPYAGTYYPIYNSGTNQYIPALPSMPFNKVSMLFFAFAHAYPVASNHAALTLEEGQPLEPARIAEVMLVAKSVNPQLLFMISLGWGKNDWTYINTDYETYMSSGGGNIQNFAFGQSVVSLLRTYNLDGFDIDDESLPGTSGYISQQNFNGVIALIRQTLDAASKQDGKPYYFSITPAGGTAMITSDNIGNFDLINTQDYGGSSYQYDFKDMPGANIGMFAYGVNSEASQDLPSSSEIAGMAGVFNWSFSADSSDSNPPFAVTNGIAQLVGYNASEQTSA